MFPQLKLNGWGIVVRFGEYLKIENPSQRHGSSLCGFLFYLFIISIQGCTNYGLVSGTSNNSLVTTSSSDFGSILLTPSQFKTVETGRYTQKIQVTLTKVKTMPTFLGVEPEIAEGAATTGVTNGKLSLYVPINSTPGRYRLNFTDDNGVLKSAYLYVLTAKGEVVDYPPNDPPTNPGTLSVSPSKNWMESVGGSILLTITNGTPSYTLATSSPSGCIKLVGATTTTPLLQPVEPYPLACPYDQPMSVTIRDNIGREGTVSVQIKMPDNTPFWVLFQNSSGTQSNLIPMVSRLKILAYNGTAPVSLLKVIYPGSTPAWTSSSTTVPYFKVVQETDNVQWIEADECAPFDQTFELTFKDASSTPKTSSQNSILKIYNGTPTMTCPTTTGQITSKWSSTIPTSTAIVDTRVVMGTALIRYIVNSSQDSSAIAVKEFRFKATGQSSYTTITPNPLRAIAQRDTVKLYSTNQVVSLIDLGIDWSIWTPTQSGTAEVVLENQSATTSPKPITTLSGWTILASNTQSVSLTANPSFLVPWDTTPTCTSGTSCWKSIDSVSLSASSTIDWSKVSLNEIELPTGCVNTAMMLPANQLFTYENVGGSSPKIKFIHPISNGDTNAAYRNVMHCMHNGNLKFKFITTESGKNLNPLTVPFYYGQVWVKDDSLASYKNFLTFGGMTSDPNSVAGADATTSTFKNYSLWDSISKGWGVRFPMYNIGTTLRVVYNQQYNYNGVTVPTILIYSTKGLPSGTSSSYPNTAVSKIRYLYSSNNSLFSNPPTQSFSDCEDGVCAIRIPLTNLPVGMPGSNTLSYRGGISLQINDMQGQYTPPNSLSVPNSISATEATNWLPLSCYWGPNTCQMPDYVFDEYPDYRIEFCIDLANPSEMKIVHTTQDQLLWPAFEVAQDVTKPSAQGMVVNGLSLGTFNGGKTYSAFEWFQLKRDHEGLYQPRYNESNQQFQNLLPMASYVQGITPQSYFYSPVHIGLIGHGATYSNVGHMGVTSEPGCNYPGKKVHTISTAP